MNLLQYTIGIMAVVLTTTVMWVLFYAMLLFFYIGFTLNHDNCYNLATGEVVVCETGEHVEYRSDAFWQ